MSGVKRKIEDNDPDYEDITQLLQNKRSKVVEQNGKISLPCTNWSDRHSNTVVHFSDLLSVSFLFWPARDAAVQKIEAIIKDQFALEMKNKEHEIEVIGQVMSDKITPEQTYMHTCRFLLLSNA